MFNAEVADPYAFPVHGLSAGGLLSGKHLFRHKPQCPVRTEASLPVVKDDLPGLPVDGLYMQRVDQTAPFAEDEIIPQLFRHIL